MIRLGPVFRGVVTSYAFLFVNGLTLFVLTPLLLRFLGQEGFGLWTAYMSVAGYLGLLNFGLGVAATKYTAAYQAEGRREELNEVINGVFWLFALIGVALIAVTVAFSPLAPKLFHASPPIVRAGQVAFAVLGVAVALRLTANVFGSVVYGVERVDAYKALAGLQVVLYVGLCALFLYLGWGIVGVSAALLVSNAVLLVAYRWFLWKSIPWIHIKPKLVDRAVLKSILPYSLRSFWLSLTARIINQTDVLVIGAFMGPKAITSYALAYTLIFSVGYASSAMAEVVFPRFARMYAEGHEDRLRTEYLRVARLGGAIGMVATVSLALTGESFISFWVGPENFVGNKVFSVFLVFLMLGAVATPAGLVLQAAGQNKQFAISETMNAVLNLGLSVILVRTLGTFGVAIATVVAVSLTSLWYGAVLATRLLRLPMSIYLRQAVLRPIAAGAPAAAAGYLVRQLLRDVPVPLGIVTVCGAVGITYVASAYLWVLSSEERGVVRRSVRTTIMKSWNHARTGKSH